MSEQVDQDLTALEARDALAAFDRTSLLADDDRGGSLMPNMPFEAPSDEPLFPDDDPLTISISGGGTYRCLDHANPPIETDVDPVTRPVSYFVEALRLQVVEEERDAFEAELVEAVKDNRIMLKGIMAVANWLTEQRRDAEKGTVARAVKRPTKARQRSTRS